MKKLDLGLSFLTTCAEQHSPENGNNQQEAKLSFCKNLEGTIEV